MLDLRLSQPTIENLLRDTILYALGQRIQSVASIAALRAQPTQASSMPQYNDDRLISVTTSPVQSYRWSTVSTATDDGVNVIQPNDVTANGRWIKWTSPIYFSPTVNGNSTTLDQLSNGGPLRRVILVDKKFQVDEMIALLGGRDIAVIVEPKGSDPEELTLNTGARYETTYRFEIHIVAENLRDRREAMQGSVVAGDPDPGAYSVDGFIRALISGASLAPALDALSNVRPGRAEIWSSEYAERAVVFSRLYDVIVTEELQNAPNEFGAIQDLTAQEHLATMPVTPPLQTTVVPPVAAFDPNNYLVSGIAIAYPVVGLTQPITAGSALIAGSTVTYAGANNTFAAYSDTYRDLNPNGTLTFVAVPNDALQPPVTANALRIGATRTNATGIVSDVILAGTYNTFGPRWDYGAV